MPISETISTKLRRIAQLAREAPDRAFVSLGHNLDMDWMREAYRRTRKDGAAGVDGQTARQYEQKLEENLQGLLDRAKSGTYKAPPVRRVHIPKGDGKSERPNSTEENGEPPRGTRRREEGRRVKRTVEGKEGLRCQS